MTILLNLLLAGILTILVSIGIIIFSVGFIHKKFASLVLVLLSILLLLVGGGYAPPLLGLATAIGALLIHTPIRWLKANLPGFVLCGSSRLWPWVFGICLILWFYLFPGSIILAFLFGLNNPMLIVPFSFSGPGVSDTDVRHCFWKRCRPQLSGENCITRGKHDPRNYHHCVALLYSYSQLLPYQDRVRIFLDR
jgi:hypothetical protein